jgi:hypothetical protein
MDKTDQEYLKSCLDQTTELRKQINKTIQSNIQMSKNCFEKLEHLKEMARGLHIEATQLLNMIVINNKEGMFFFVLSDKFILKISYFK